MAPSTPGGGVSDLGGGKITGPHQRLLKKACFFSTRSRAKVCELLKFSVLFEVVKIGILSYRVPVLGFLIKIRV